MEQRSFVYLNSPQILRLRTMICAAIGDPADRDRQGDIIIALATTLAEVCAAAQINVDDAVAVATGVYNRLQRDLAAQFAFKALQGQHVPIAS
jgi:hypothetical protein